MIINVHQLILSKAVSAGDFIFLTSQLIMKVGGPMTEGNIKEQN